MLSAVQAVLTGATSHKATLKVQIGVRTTVRSNGTEGESAVNLSVRCDGATSIRDALNRIASMSAVAIKVPREQENFASLGFSPVMKGSRAAVLLAYYAKVAYPTSLGESTVKEHLAACGIATESTSEPTSEPISASMPKKRRGRKADADAEPTSEPETVAANGEAVPA